MKDVKLSKSMKLEDFQNGYFYAAELKVFAREIGIKVANFRKFEIEQLIASYLETGKVPEAKPTLPRHLAGKRDVLYAANVVTNYVGDKKTKSFLLSLVDLQVPALKPKSGQWYWLNDWRRRKQAEAAVFTYQDLADHLMTLMQTKGRLPQIPSARMNNFITDFNADPINEGVTRAEVIAAWEVLKQHSGPKTYEEYRRISQ